MAKKDKPIKIYKGKEGYKIQDLKVGFGKYKNKQLVWVAKNDLEFFKEIEVLYYTKYSQVKQKHYDKLKIRFIQKNGLVTKEQLHDKIHEVVGLIRQRITGDNIHKYLEEKYNFPYNTRVSIISDAKFLRNKEFELEKDYLIDIHLLRYENIYYDNINPNLDHVQPGFRKAVKCEHFITALETLFQKEKLLGIHTKKFKLHINSNVVSKKVNTDFDMNMINMNEQLELLELLNKAKPTEVLVRPIVANENPLDIDISYKNEDDDVIEAPIQKSKQTDEIGDSESKELKSRGKSFDEVKESINKTLNDKVRELFEKKNKK